MAGERLEGAQSIPVPSAGAAERLIAQRLRETVADSAPPPQTELLSQYAVARWLEGDAGHLQRAADLRGAPIASHRGVLGRPVVASKRMLRRLLHPLIDIQSEINAANARVVAFLLAQLAVQAGCIDELQREVAELRAERGP